MSSPRNSIVEESSGGSVVSHQAKAEMNGGPDGHNRSSNFSHDGETDPVCLVACRLPGGINSPSQLWDFLARKGSAQGPVPELRFNIKGFYHPDPDSGRAGVIGAGGGYFLQRDVRQFDNSFFGINNLEAAYMDPLQRQLLEVVYECLENAGRFSFTLDTGCSASLYCLHHAVRAIQSRDCDGAIVAAANLITSPEQHIGTWTSGILSAQSSCRTFDVSADGYGRAEAVNAVYLKRLSDARRDGDKIWAVIRGTAVNANGSTPGLLQPSRALQAAAIRKAYKDAGLDFRCTDYVECHGTGTSVGDPIEVDALASCFCPRDGEPLRIGSFEVQLVSRNFKVVTETESWPRNLRRAGINSFGYGGANAHVILESIESFQGYATLEEACAASDPEERLYVLPISAASKGSLQTRVDQVSQLIRRPGPNILPRLAFTLTERRSHLRHRDYLLIKPVTDDSSASYQTKCLGAPGSTSAMPSSFAFVFTGQGAQYAGMSRELLKSDRTFLDTIRRLDQVLGTLSPSYKPDWTLQHSIAHLDTDEVQQVTLSQPLCTAVQIGLVNVLRSWNVVPRAVVGHSSGEIAAAYAAGLITEAQAIIAAHLRGYALDQIPPGKTTTGAMLAVGLGAEAADSLIRENELTGKVSVGCINAPESVTLSGTLEGINELEDKIKQLRRFARLLKTGGRGYHSQMMRAVGPLYEQLLTANLESMDSPAQSDVTAEMYSSVGRAGEKLRVIRKPIDMTTYWRQNLEKPVQFQRALESLINEGKCHLIEIGPHSALKEPIQQIRAHLSIDKDHLPYSPTLIRGQDAAVRMKNLAGNLFVHGHDLEWSKINDSPKSGLRHLYDLAPYPWDHNNLLWHEPRASVELRNRKHPRHELLGSMQLSGDGIDWNWRNILRLNEMPWIRDHSLEDRVVFPAAGYLAIAIEAISQVRNPNNDIRDDTSDRLLFRIRNVNIPMALFLRDPGEASQETTELHTTLSPHRLSATTVSAFWYDFIISSWVVGRSTVHCVGEIRADYDVNLPGSVLIPDVDVFERSNPNRWYEKSRENGFGFENSFRSLVSVATDGNRVRPESACSIRLTPPVAKGPYTTQYPIHPITIDACIQAGIIAGTSGRLSVMGAWLPASISEARIRTLRRNLLDSDGEIHARSRKTGPSTRRIHSTLRDRNSETIIDLKDMRLSSYKHKKFESNKVGDRQHGRHPCLRVNWSPDITRLDRAAESQINGYVSNHVHRSRINSEDELDKHLTYMGALLSLAGHKNPRLRVLEIAGTWCEARTKHLQNILGVDGAFPRCCSWHVATLDETGTLEVEGDAAGQYDVILISEQLASQRCWAQLPAQLITLAGDYGIIITGQVNEAYVRPYASHLTVLEIQNKILLALHPFKRPTFEGKDIVIVLDRPSAEVASFGDRLKEYMQQNFELENVATVCLENLHDVRLGGNTICISMLEIEHAFLARMGSADMVQLRRITDIVSDLLWLTSADILGKAEPDLALCFGFFRALKLEQPSLRCSIMDIGPFHDLSRTLQVTCENISKCLSSEKESGDTEFVQKGRLIYISRYGPDAELNSLFTRRMMLEGTKATQEEALDRISPVQLCIDQAGIADSIHFMEVRNPPTSPPAGFIDVDIKAVSLNAKDVYAMNGRVETKGATTILEFSGVVVALGPDVEHLELGDRVVVMAPNHFTTTERVPTWATQKILPTEKFSSMATLPLVYSTALYALHDRANLENGESVLITSGAGALGMALITIAQRIGAVIYTTAGTQLKREYLIQKFGIPSSHVFSSHASFAQDLLAATGGSGVNVIVNSLVGDLMHESWECIARFGRFVEVGKRELVDAGRLNLHIFLRNATFTAFDLTELYYDEDHRNRNIWASKLKEVLELYRSGQIKEAPITTFDVANTIGAYRYFSSKDRIGSRLGGVVQAAMGLQEALFSRMTSEAWQTAVRPKWAGTWNLHNALEGHDLDFFLLTSSMSGSVGTATESNYCAANSFLDAFARWRRSQGKPAVSVGLGMISEVGYLHENPEIGSLLMRKGVQPLDEEEFLQIIDMAVAGIGDAHNDPAASHILTGLEPFGVRKLMARGFEVDFVVGKDPRLAVLSAAAAEKEVGTGPQTADLLGLQGPSPPWLKAVPSTVASSFMPVMDAPSLQAAVLRLTKKQFSNLILSPVGEIDDYAPLPQYGVDSMIASEFRTWFWRTLQVDVPFHDLLSPQKDLQGLAHSVSASWTKASDLAPGQSKPNDQFAA
ncbi:hypothetical protein DL765_003155 [Monosporascus sp. GIB2]|nr:hypothetical protein DL765_003155 [Monosporascus sp. GIB2]